MQLDDEVKEALNDLAGAEKQARSGLVVSKDTVLKAMDAAARLAKTARALPDLQGDRREQLWQFLENPYMRMAMDTDAIVVDRPDNDHGETTTQIVTPNGGRFDAAGFIRRLNNEWRAILDAR
ncbi:MAG: hypothetical protein AAF414_18995 [Pseudomonadota bacterium]